MPLRLWLLALCPLMLSGCSTVPQSAPVAIAPPPVALISRCQSPGDLPAEATAQALAAWTMEWIGAFGCERAKRTALIEAWPR